MLKDVKKNMNMMKRKNGIYNKDPNRTPRDEKYNI